MLCVTPAFADTQEVGETLTVGVPVDRCPVFYVDEEDDEITGIGVDLMRYAAEKAGYDVTFKAMTESSLKEALDSSEYDVVMPFGSAVSSAAGRKTIISNNLIQTPFTLVTKGKQDFPSISSIRIGMLKSQSAVVETVKSKYPGTVIVTYETMPDCVKALRSGEVEALLHNSYVWSYVLQKPSYKDLVVQPSTMFSMDFRAGTLDTPEGREIIDRLNEGIAHISDTRRQAITLDYTSHKLYKYDLSDYIYDYGVFAVLAVLLVIAIIIITVQRAYVVRKRQEEKIRELVDYDTFTGVLSLTGFKKRAEELIRDNPDNPYFLSFNNIRDFKYINDSLGREAGDELLKFWVEKSVENLKADEAIGRITADRFVVLRHIFKDEEMRADEKRIIEPVQNYFINKGLDTRVQLCSGIYVLAPDDFKNPDIDHMLDLARVAEKRIRHSRDENFSFYNPEQWEKGMLSAEIISSLPAAISNGEIEVFYQPQVDFNTRNITGAEALCRWQHTKLGYLQPSEFIPVLERAGLTFALDEYVWNKVCQDLQKWNERGQHRSVSVNVSRKDIREDRKIPEYFNSLVEKYNLTPDQLHIELTESAYIDNPEILISTAEKLRSFGFKVEMDDFGSGYSSLHMLKEVPVDRIKLDLHFLTESGDPEKSHIIVSCIIRMAKQLGIELITEGVETVEQANFLHSEGADEMQGYYFYKPMKVADFEKEIGI
jgi:EAL domain-containing protein (putative c-di-GMP-specific phosphodiesterase class I)/GGDEF domain-containing protein/ABC-type amino acid transport substrate-binding protein